jgi:hypothetical protein
MFEGWWYLRRRVILSAVELAKTFDGPILSDMEHSNMDVRMFVDRLSGSNQCGVEVDGTGETKLKILPIDSAVKLDRKRTVIHR